MITALRSPRLDRYLIVFGMGVLGCLCLPVGFCLADEAPVPMELIEVIGIAPIKGELNGDSLPYAVQGFDKNDLDRSGIYSIAEMLSGRAGSVTTNAAQNNRLQPDIQFRGFTASPLLGLPQGVAVYQNGVRVNEVFGDSVNWDLLPAISVESMHIVAGSNPVYGLNALGGAFIVQTKTGFSDQDKAVGITLGSDAAREITLSAGGNNGEWGAFVAISGMEEDGWRDHSESDTLNAYAAVSWRGDSQEFDLYFNSGDSKLRGNGTVPRELLDIDRSAVFTHPDITENDLTQISFSYRRWYSDDSQLSINTFYRQNTTDGFNGDGSEFEECELPLYDGYLCDDDDDEILEDQFGDPVAATWDAINNRSRRKQRSGGFTAQWIQSLNWVGVSQQLLVGADYIDGETDFESSVEFAELTDTRGTVGSGLFFLGDETELKSSNRTASLYLSDSIRVNQQLNVTLSARYNDSHIESHDRSGENPDLEGNHSYKRVNAGLGMIYHWSDQTQVYGSVQRTSRTPTPVELACSHPEAPCNLPNNFLADPPLDDVVSRGIELGLRGHWDGLDRWRLGLFHITNRDDIIFQSTGGVSSNEGFFTNAADTVRKGLEVELAGHINQLSWYGNYSYLHASFGDSFLASTPNHPQAVDGVLLVDSGSRLPGLPEHSIKIGMEYHFNERGRLGLDFQAYGGQFLRGDEANKEKKTSGYGIMNIHGSYQLSRNIELQFKVDNIFDKEYESFGLYGSADEVLEDIDSGSNRFLGPGAPTQYWLSINFNW